MKLIKIPNCNIYLAKSKIVIIQLSIDSNDIYSLSIGIRGGLWEKYDLNTKDEDEATRILNEFVVKFEN